MEDGTARKVIFFLGIDNLIVAGLLLTKLIGGSKGESLSVYLICVTGNSMLTDMGSIRKSEVVFERWPQAWDDALQRAAIEEDSRIAISPNLSSLRIEAEEET